MTCVPVVFQIDVRIVHCSWKFCAVIPVRSYPQSYHFSRAKMRNQQKSRREKWHQLFFIISVVIFIFVSCVIRVVLFRIIIFKNKKNIFLVIKKMIIFRIKTSFRYPMIGSSCEWRFYITEAHVLTNSHRYRLTHQFTRTRLAACPPTHALLTHIHTYAVTIHVSVHM